MDLFNYKVSYQLIWYKSSSLVLMASSNLTQTWTQIDTWILQPIDQFVTEVHYQINQSKGNWNIKCKLAHEAHTGT